MSEETPEIHGVLTAESLSSTLRGGLISLADLQLLALANHAPACALLDARGVSYATWRSSTFGDFPEGTVDLLTRFEWSRLLVNWCADLLGEDKAAIHAPSLQEHLRALPLGSPSMKERVLYMDHLERLEEELPLVDFEREVLSVAASTCYLAWNDAKLDPAQLVTEVEVACRRVSQELLALSGVMLRRLLRGLVAGRVVEASPELREPESQSKASASLL